MPRLIFPVVGPATYTNDFGDPRGSNRHAGIDIMAPKRALAVAVEEGTVKFWTTSSRAGCMLYLYGRSGTTYLYIHLNNDLTLQNDNRGACVPGVAYAPGLKSGAKVQAGEVVGYVGDSGDADGISPHLHFEVVRGGTTTVNPFAHLNRAQRLLFAAKPGTTFRLTLQGKVVEAAPGNLAVEVEQLRRFPGGLHVRKVNRTVRLQVPPDVVVFNPVGAVIAQARLSQAKPGQPATVWTQPAPATLPAQLGAPNVLAAERVALLGEPPVVGPR
ncbi:MAG TPA: M23 family metallopeptidase [Gaiellaceae bacterium]|nr:M23 family metallopeptidase [Gaiellaceae bacterium]